MTDTCLDIAGSLEEWPNCSTPDCPAKVCFRFQNGKCWPCTMRMPVNWGDKLTQKQAEKLSREIEAHYWERRKL